MKRLCAMALAILMIITVLPVSAFAGSIDESLTEANFTVIDNDQSTLAPGVTLNEVVLYNSNNQRVEMYVTTVDTTVDTVQVKANYMNNQNKEFGMQTLSEQVAAMEANYPEPFKIVAGINASYYNTTTGQPTGAFVMEGIDASASGDGYAFFAVLKDGTYMIGNKGEYSAYKDQLQEAIGGWQHIVIDGAVAKGLDKTTLYPRQTLGLTADGKLILMTADGSQAPTTVGLTIQEQAEVMLSLGCVDAIHLDGGNSATFGIIPEGEDTFVTKNSPSGGAERAVSNTLMIISTAVPDGTFDHAVINSDYEYFVPNSTYTFSAFGVDATNAAAEIPETAVWTLSDSSFGSISNGKFVSNGALGQVNIQLTDNGKVIGSRTINIVNPTSISFALSETTVPYGKSASLPVSALYGNFETYSDADAYSFTVANTAAGTMDGFQFTANNDETINSTVVTAAYKYDSTVRSVSITVNFGKGSEVLFDFEDGDISDWKGTDEYKEWREAYNSNNPDYPLYDPDDYSNGIDKQTSSVFLATEENGGKVKNGEYALGFRMNHTQLTDVAGWIYNYLYYTGETKVLRDVANGQTAIRIGMWVYSPDITNVAFRIVRGTQKADGTVGITYKYMKSDYDGKNVSYATNYGIPEAGWIYIYYDLTDLADTIVQTTSISGATLNGTNKNADYYPAFLQLFTGSATDTMSDMVFYIDDITLDYSDVTEDRDAPTISDMVVSTDGSNDVALNGQTVNTNVLSFSAKVTDVSDNTNATGLNYSTAKIYVDGIDVSGNGKFKAANGYITLNDIYLTNGQHSVAFVIFDNQGNETRVTKTITVNGTAKNSVVSVVGRNEGNHTPKAGSIYYIDIKASDAAQISRVVTTLKLNTANRFEYNNVICAKGVTAEVSYDELDFEVTVTLTHDGSLDGEAVLASIPVRVWAWDEEYTGITASKQFATTAIPVIDIECKTVYGAVTYTDNAYGNYVCGFYGAMDVATELDNDTVWHEHTAVALDDVAATCTTDGYTGRTYCAGCASIVAWGTAQKATGHDWQFNAEGKLSCANNGELYSGIYTDGKTYVDGVVLSDGWIEVDGVKTYYYVDGVKLTGSHFIDGAMCTFDENGVYLPNHIHDGWYAVGDTAMYYINNSYVTGCVVQNYVPYYFNDNGLAFDGEFVIDGKKCVFDNGCFASCEDASVIDAGWCGTDVMNVEYSVYADGSIRITGEGEMMDFETVHSVYWTQYVRSFIKSIFIGKDITGIGDQAFRNCFYASTLTFEEGSKLENIGASAFLNLRCIDTLVLPDSVKTIDWGSFGYMYGLKTIYLPDGVESINANAFVKSNSNLVLQVARNTPAHAYAERYGFAFELREKKPVATAFGTCGENATWTLYNDEILVIGGSGAMDDFASRDEQPWAAYRNKLTKIVIGKDITHVGKFAFAYSYNVESVTFEEGSKLESIGALSIYYMLYLESLDLPETVTTVGGQAFGYNSLLSNVRVPQRISSIASNAFLKSSNVVLNVAEGSYAEKFATNNQIAYTTREYVYSVIDSGACGADATWTFYENGTLVIGGSGKIDDYASRDEQPWAAHRNEITEIVIGKNITHLGKFAFAYAYNVSAITFEEGSQLMSIGSFAIFYMHRNLTELALPDSVTTIAGQAIGYNTVLTYVRLPQFATSIASNAFLKSTNVVLNVAAGTYAESFAENNGIAYTTRDYVDMPIASGMCGENATWELYEDGKLVIGGSGAMADYASRDAQPWAAYRNEITEIVIGKDITHLGKFAFAYSYNVRSITFEEGSQLKSIGSFAIFYMYRNLTELTLPDSVTTIAGQAIGYNTALVNVYVPESVTSIASNAFVKSTNIILNVADGSYAETFATANGIAYVIAD